MPLLPDPELLKATFFFDQPEKNFTLDLPDDTACRVMMGTIQRGVNAGDAAVGFGCAGGAALVNIEGLRRVIVKSIYPQVSTASTTDYRIAIEHD